MISRISRFSRGENAFGLLLALCVFCVYLTTLAPSVGFIDAGELAAVAHTFGVAHPTGYPLFTLVAGVFSHLPLGESVIWRLNLFAALCCAASVFFFFKFFRDLIGRVLPEADGFPALGGAATAALTLAFSRTFWSQATGVEVYSLHLLLVSLLLVLFARALPGEAFGRPAAAARKSPKAAAGPAIARKPWFLFAFVLGLGFSNHMTTVLLLPALGVAYFVAYGWRRAEAWRAAASSVPFFLAGLLPYLYLPLRASAGPALNWGAIVDLESFAWHVTGRQYSGWMFSSLEAARRQLGVFTDGGISETGLIAVVFALLGLWTLFRRAPRLLAFALLLFFGCLLYAVNYDISDVANYFLLAYVATALAAAFGAARLLGWTRSRGARAFAVAGCAACVALPFALHYRDVDENGNYAVEDYARALLESAEPNAVIFSAQWDHFVAGAWYLQVVEGYRRDVSVVDHALLRRSWYLRHLARREPALIEGARAEVAAFLPELRKFETGRPYDPAVIQGRFDDMVRKLLAEAARVRPVYITSDIEPSSIGALRMAPAGALLRLYPEGASVPVAPRTFAPRPFPKDNVYFRELRRMYAGAYVNQALFFASINELGLAESFLGEALAVDPGHVQARGLLARLQALPAASRIPPSMAVP